MFIYLKIKFGKYDIDLECSKLLEILSAKNKYTFKNFISIIIMDSLSCID